MAQTIEVAKAVHLLGIKRSQLQKLIKSGDLSTFEGKIDVEELKACFPSTAFLKSAFEAELEFIKKAAYSNRVQNAILPSTEDISSQLHQAQVKLLVEKQKANNYLDTLQKLLRHIADLRSNASQEEKKAIDNISQWILNHMNNKP